MVALDPKNPLWKLTLARLYLDAGQRAQARTELSALAALGKEFRQQDEVQKLLKEL
ncbi:tetratricopeptide repeat protein [Azohydromonas aeria]|uniref:tetratricopeptide repeat protein n=1 Tax=Azohydromonas aeria TaxID=2590212 RepID=UPI0035C1C73B